jgi:hypothetical protein
VVCAWELIWKCCEPYLRHCLNSRPRTDHRARRSAQCRRRLQQRLTMQWEVLHQFIKERLPIDRGRSFQRSLSGRSQLSAPHALRNLLSILHNRHIATFYLRDLSVTSYCPQVWDARENWHHRMVYTALRDALELERHLMSICPQWQIARESTVIFLSMLR